MPESQQIESVLSSGVVLNFVETARQFCALIEQHDAYEVVPLLKEAHKLLPLLYYQALLLPDVEGPDKFSEGQTTFEEWKDLFFELRDKLGKHDGYWLVHNPLELDEPVYSSLSDDLPDIYGDLKEGLLLWERDTAVAQEEAVWQWRFTFRFHWSHHAVEALTHVTQS